MRFSRFLGNRQIKDSLSETILSPEQMWLGEIYDGKIKISKVLIFRERFAEKLKIGKNTTRVNIYSELCKPETLHYLGK